MGSCKDPLNIRVFLSLLWETGLNLEMSKLSSQTITEVIVSFTSHLFFIFVYKIFFFFTMSNHLFFRERLCMDIVSLILRFNDGVIDQSQSQALILFTCSSFPGSEWWLHWCSSLGAHGKHPRHRTLFEPILGALFHILVAHCIPSWSSLLHNLSSMGL